MRILLVFLLIIVCSISTQRAVALEKPILIPTPLQNISPNFVIIGSTNLNFFGLKVYRVSLWCEDKNFSYDKKFGIHIKYNMNFKRDDLVKKSISEIKKLHELSAKEELNYVNQITSILNSVKKGDEKLAIFIPLEGVIIFHNNEFVGKISDPKLARLFVDIWLDERGSYPKVTRKILGINTK